LHEHNLLILKTRTHTMLKLNILLLSVFSTAMWAQQGNTGAGPGMRPSLPTTGKIEIRLSPARAIGNLDTLIRASSLVFEGTVLTTLESVQRDPKIAHSIETPVVMAVDQLLKGVPGDGKRVITVNQPGGTRGSLEVSAPEAPVMKPGEKYILFVQQVQTQLEPSTSYYISGGWAGLVKVMDNAVLLSPRNSDELRAYNGKSREMFLKDVDDRLNHRTNLKKTESRADIPWPVQDGSK
jgi:hypothetical protein